VTGLEKILYCDVLDHHFYYIIYQEIQCTKKYNVPRNTTYQKLIRVFVISILSTGKEEFVGTGDPDDFFDVYN